MITLPIPLLWLALAVAVFFLSLLFAAHVKSKRLAKRFATCSAAVANAQLRLDQQIA
jgi:hypothetical protein